MLKNIRYLKLKICGIGIFMLALFLLSQKAIKQKDVISSDKKPEEQTHELNTLIQEESDELTDLVSASLAVSEWPIFNGDPYALMYEDIPRFTDEDVQSLTGVVYAELDELGRCGTAYGLIGPETIPKEERGPIGDVKPSGWHTVRYDELIEDRYLYNRCHLIGYQLAGANAEECNLITGTRYLNTSGMLPIENQIWSYVTETGNHVLYRVTPVFERENLLASGVLIEAYSVEDEGKGIEICRYLFNVQPGVIIDYLTGDSWLDESDPLNQKDSEKGIAEKEESYEPVIHEIKEPENPEEATYVLNIHTMRFHEPSCQSVEEMKAKNRRYTIDTREELIELGYVPCGRCHP